MKAFLNNLLLLFLLYMLCRAVYVAEFWDLYSAGWAELSLGSLLRGGLRFDTSAIIYTNLLWLLVVLLPWPCRWYHSAAWQKLGKWLFVVVNALMLSINLFDTVYSRYTGRRTTWSFFSEFSNEGNLGSIAGIELLRHWYLVLIGLAFIAALILCYRPIPARQGCDRPRRHYLGHTAAFLLLAPLCVAGMRGGFSTAIRPITISNANQYVNQPSEAAIVLNTPFALLRTMGKTTFEEPRYFDPAALDSIYSPLRQPADSTRMMDPAPNVVVLIVESLATEYVGFYNPGRPSATPFLDSLIGQSLTFRESFANGRKSIDAMPSVLSSIPMFVEPFFVTNYSLNDVSGIAGELSKAGYATAFFHGAENGSMGFQAFARTSGFADYYGRTEFCADSRFDGDKSFDGTWAIWDEEFLQFYAMQMETMPQPFCTAVFTATSHHPFVIPERYQQQFRQPGHPMHTCIRYVDHALRRFFRTASRMPWYANTLFVITADHTNITEQPEYRDALGTFRVPVIFFDPSGRMPRGVSDAVAQQIDIMPTLLAYLGYPNPYVAFGIDLLSTPPQETWAVQYNNGIYQYYRDGSLLSYDPSQPAPADAPHLPHLQAIIQSYMHRMIGNQLVP